MSPRRVRVALPLAVDRAFDYAVDDAQAEGITQGCRVLVPLRGRARVGVVVVLDPPPAAGVPRALECVIDVLDDPACPSLTPALIDLCEFTARYYVAPIGEVVRAALPGLLGADDPRTLAITPRGRDRLAAELSADAGPLLSRQGIDRARLETPVRALLQKIVAAGGGGLAVPAVLDDRALRQPYRALTAAQREGWIVIDSTVEDAGTARVEPWVCRTDRLRGSGDEAELAAFLGRSKRRRALLDALEAHADWMPLSDLRAAFRDATTVLAPLIEAGLVARQERPIRLDPYAATPPARVEHALSDEQASALSELTGALESGTFACFLLQGVTGSGKTEVYLRLIARARARGRGAIVLVPEIALTPQLGQRFRAWFGDEVVVLHSGLSPRRRLDAWHQIRTGSRSIVIGARSAVFAPVASLGVIVVDEEHDASFKQEEGVRYHARDLALVRGRTEGACVVLGSATPSLETWQAGRCGRYRHLWLHHRPTAQALPEVEIVDLAVHRPDPASLMSAKLRQAVLETVARGEQAILFLNRRGFSPALRCKACGQFVACADCSAPSMTYHLKRNRLLCHLCGAVAALPSTCAHCGGGELVHDGAGTERVELALSEQLAGARIARLDRDTSRGERLVQTLDRFRARKADVLIGTQMLAKGHDFPLVTLVGVLSADHGLAMPDPRAGERTFQLLAQVAGRAGRGDRPGRVMLQSYNPKHPVIEAAARHDFMGFAHTELAMRELLGNPPFGHLALVRVTSPDRAAAKARSDALAESARRMSGVDEAGQPAVRVLGPMPSPHERINAVTRFQVLLRAPKRPALLGLLGRLRPELGDRGSGTARSRAFVDVDPQTFA